jgi:hypothetical protein
VQKAQQDLKAASEAVPPVYLLEWQDMGVPSVDEVRPTEKAPELNWDEPLLFKKFSCLETFKSCPKGQMLLGGFGGTFKKSDAYKNSHWYQKAVSEKSMPEVKALFSEAVALSNGLTHDQLGSVGGVVETYWLYGQDAKTKWCFTPRNGLAQLRYLGAGGLSCLILLPSRFPSELQEVPYDDAKNMIENCDVEFMKKLIEAKCVFMVEQEQFDMLYIPTASMVCEVALRTQALIFGLRKPMIIRGPSHHLSYAWLMDAYQRSERPCGKMQDALDLMKGEKSATEAAPGAADAAVAAEAGLAKAGAAPADEVPSGAQEAAVAVAELFAAQDAAVAELSAREAHVALALVDGSATEAL